MGIMDIFTNRTPAVAVIPAPATVANPANNPTVPGPNNPVPQGPKSPLDNYAKLWEKPQNGDNQPKPSMVPALNLDPTKLRESASKIDFVGQINPETVKKAIEGDVSSFMTVINQAVQLGFAQSLAGSAEITRQSMESAQSSLNKTILPEAIRLHHINAELMKANPAFNDPAVAPLLESLKTQFANAYPTASAAEIAEHAKEYLSGVAGKITGISPAVVGEEGNKRNSLVRKQEDWGAFFDDVSAT